MGRLYLTHQWNSTQSIGASNGDAAFNMLPDAALGGRKHGTIASEVHMMHAGDATCYLYAP